MAACLWLLLPGGAGVAWGQAVLVGDAHVSQAQPDVNTGGLSNLNVGGGYAALLQFDLSLLPAGTTSATVSRAVLRVYANRVDAAGTVAVAPLLGAWTEAGVTWNSQPAAGAAVQTAGVAGAGQFVVFDVTSTVKAWVAGTAANDGLVLTAGSAVVVLDSKENDLTSHAPELVVTLAAGGGATGATGAQGPVGPQGLAGPAGPQGVAGVQGPAGLSGSMGAQGPAGVTGAQGPAGAAGAAGPQGAAGATGATGAAGAIGSAGAKGDAGFVYQGAYLSTTNYALGDVALFGGSSYVSLVAGNHGNTPAQSAGYWAVLAAQGPVGLQGATGAAGAAGPQGLPGSVGPPGERGDQGLQGIAGQAGAQGIPGATGATGLSGPMGPEGVAGPTGLNFRGAYDATVNYALADGVLWQGAGWVSLLAGNHGNTPDQSPGAWAMFAARGDVGATGATGAQGVQGITGATGPVGAMGAVGVTGATGMQGLGLNVRGTYDSTVNYGVNDVVTWQGGGWVSLVAANHGNTPDVSPGYWQLLVAQGVVGPQGAAGAAGAAGATGPAGATGVQGLTGPPVAFAGAWDATRTYAVGDAVSFSGASYIAVAGSVGQQPDTSAAVWCVLSSRGAQGPVGAQGLTGPQGLRGDTGAAGAQGPAGQAGAQGIAGPAGPMGATGPQGAAGAQGVAGVVGATGAAGPVGMNFRGPWNPSARYAVNDAVTFAGSTYLAQAAQMNDEPDTDASSWTVVAQAGSMGPTGAAATVAVGTVTMLAAGATPTVTNTGSGTAAVLNFGIPQGATGATGAPGASGGGGASTSTAGGSFAAMYHAVDYTATYYALNSGNRAASETASVLAWVPLGCTAARLDVYSQQSNNVTVTLRTGTPGSMAATSVACTTAQGGCTVSPPGGVVVAAGSFVDLSIAGASGSTAGVWTALQCN